MKETIFFVNPTAGSGRAGRLWKDLKGSLGSPPFDVAGRNREDATRCLTAALERTLPSRVVVVGGDGTVNLAVNVLQRRGLGGVTLGIVPAGTGSDLASSLSLPAAPVEALSVALEGGLRDVDAISALTRSGDETWSVNVAGAGLSGAVDRLLAHRGPGRRKRYLPATLRTLATYDGSSVRLSVDGETPFERRCYLVAVANGPTFGKGIRVAPDARLDDGLLDLVVVEAPRRWQVPWRLLRVVAGRHVGAPWVLHRRCERVSLEYLDLSPPPFDLDGEMLAESQVALSARKGVLKVAVP